MTSPQQDSLPPPPVHPASAARRRTDWEDDPPRRKGANTGLILGIIAIVGVLLITPVIVVTVIAVYLFSADSNDNGQVAAGGPTPVEVAPNQPMGPNTPPHLPGRSPKSMRATGGTPQTKGTVRLPTGPRIFPRQTPSTTPPEPLRPLQAVTPVSITPIKMASDQAEQKLPGPVADLCVGGGGRYLILFIPKVRQLAVFDASAGKVVRYLPTPAADVRIAAGMNDLIVVVPDSGVAVRYDLATFEKNLTVRLPVTVPVKEIAMGSASAGPLLVQYAKGTSALDSTPVIFVDPHDFKEITYDRKTGGGMSSRMLSSSYRDAMHFRASPDGTVFGAWATSQSPSGLNSVVVQNGTLTGYYNHDSVGSIVPGPDGTLFTTRGLFTPQLKKLTSGGLGGTPAQHGPFYLSLNNASSWPPRSYQTPAKKPSATVHVLGDPRPIVTLSDIGIPAPSRSPTRLAPSTSVDSDKRLFFSPDAELIAYLPTENDRLILTKFDITAALNKADLDYLFVASRPPVAVPGKPFEYPIDVRSKRGGVKFVLSAGPAAMRVDPKGRVTWAVPADFTEPQSVVLTISDSSGQETFHTFELVPSKLGGRAVSAVPPTTRPTPQIPGRPMPFPTAPTPLPDLATTTTVIRRPADPLEIEPTAAKEGDVVPLPGPADAVCVAGGGRFLVFRVPKLSQLAVFDATAGKVVKYLPLSDPKALLAGGATKLVVLDPKADVFQRWDLNTLEKESTVQNPLKGEVSQLLMGHATDGPLCAIGIDIDPGNHPGSPGTRFLDPLTWKSIEITEPNGRPITFARTAFQGLPKVDVSADGRVYAWHAPASSRGGITSMVIGGTTATTYTSRDPTMTTLAGPEGTVYAAGARYGEGMKKSGGGAGFWDHWYLPPVPATEGRWYLQPSKHENSHSDKPIKIDLTVKLDGASRVGIDLPEYPELFVPKGGIFALRDAGPAIPGYDRVHLIPSAGLLAILSADGGKLHLHPIDLKAKLESGSADYLVVVGRPPATVVPGKKFEYAPDVWSKKGGVAITVDNGPDGMKVVGGTKLSWPVPADFAGTQSVVLTISDSSGQQVLHTFDLAAGKPGGNTVSVVPAPTRQSIKPRPKPVRPTPAPVPDRPTVSTPFPTAPTPLPDLATTTTVIRRPADPLEIEPTAAKEGDVVPLPGPADAVCVAGGGRFLVFRVPKLSQLAVFDATAGKVVKYLPLSDPKALLAGGATKLVVLDPKADVFQRWDLNTLEKESTVQNPLKGEVSQLLMGHATDGPVCLLGSGLPPQQGIGKQESRLLDPQTWKPVDIGYASANRVFAYYDNKARVSADGRVYTYWRPNTSPSGVYSVVIDGKVLKSHHLHETAGALLPGPDGTIFSATGRFTETLTKLDSSDSRYQYWQPSLVPAAEGRWYLQVPKQDLLRQDRGGTVKLTVKLNGSSLVAIDLPEYPELAFGSRGYSQVDDARATISFYDRVHLLPSAGLLAILSADGTKLHLHPIDLKAKLKAGSADYLAVVSRPPGQAVKGNTFEYAPEVWSKNGGVAITLDAGPDGMTVAGNKVTWPVPADFADQEATVILTVQDAGGGQLLHTFRLAVKPVK